MTSLSKNIIGNIWGSTDIAANLNTICDDFGPRPAGRESIVKAADYIKAIFEKYGLETNFHQFEHPIWTQESAAFLIDGRPAMAIPFPFSKNDEFTGEAFVLNNPSEKTFEKTKFEGKILIVGASSMPHGGMGRKAMFRKAVEGGALAFVQMSGIPGGVLETGGLSTETTEIPAFACSYETGNLIARRQEAGKGEVTLKVKGSISNVTSNNIVADLPSNSEKEIVIGAHYDTWDVGPGAFDNTTGVSTVLGLAEAFSKAMKSGNKIPASLKFILFNAEELGLLGSKAYAEKFIDNKKEEVSLMMNFDCTAIRGGVRGAMTSNNMPMHMFMQKTIESYGFDCRLSLRPPHGTDAQSFSERKIPTFGLAQFKSPSWMHTAFDTPDKININELKNSTAIAGVLLSEALEKQIV
ncbi:MAG: M20/M25/M40 family metallo-hydrolase [Candidatus Hodarchaeales archaeon]